MDLTALGSLGFGAVWGWLIILIGYPPRAAGSQPRRRLFKNLLVSILFALLTLLAGLQIYLFYDWRAVLLFMLGGGGAAILHAGWLHDLQTETISEPAFKE